MSKGRRNMTKSMSETFQHRNTTTRHGRWPAMVQPWPGHNRHREYHVYITMWTRLSNSIFRLWANVVWINYIDPSATLPTFRYFTRGKVQSFYHYINKGHIRVVSWRLLSLQVKRYTCTFIVYISFYCIRSISSVVGRVWCYPVNKIWFDPVDHASRLNTLSPCAELSAPRANIVYWSFNCSYTTWDRLKQKQRCHLSLNCEADERTRIKSVF
jgi:hypothetical protein